jgi:hypothetical protein
MNTRNEIVDAIVAAYRAEVGPQGTREYVNVDDGSVVMEVAEEYEDIIRKTVTDKLANLRPDEGVRTCEDFAHIGTACCESCHTGHPQHELDLINLESGGRAWICCALDRALNPWRHEEQNNSDNYREIERALEDFYEDLRRESDAVSKQNQEGKQEFCSMQGICVLSFAFEPLPYNDSSFTAMPVVNGVRLVELVAQYEREHDFHMPGAYGGLERFKSTGSPLEHYFLGDSESEPASGRRMLLGCTCGFAECWPLLASVIRNKRHVIWQDFEQPHRPKQDYSDFGPFLFDVEQYRQTVFELAQHNGGG